MHHDQAYLEAKKEIEKAWHSGATTLDLSYKDLTELPESIGKLTQLQSLDISYNQLTQLPETLGQLMQLRSLKLIRIKLETLPEWLGQLKQLQSLNLRDNHLRALSGAIWQLPQLQLLDVSYNRLTTLPDLFEILKHLEELNLDNNPLNPALQSAYNAGLDKLKAYLRSLKEAEPLYEAKLILVGEGFVGKTTLLKALKGKEGEEPSENELTTHGVEIDINAMHLPHPEIEDVNIQLNTWDFGGQEVYRVTHQFFFSRRSLYILVWEPRGGVQKGQVEDWLNMIRLRVGSNARVIIVSTHCKTGERIARIDKPVFLRDYPDMIIRFHEVDSLVPDQATGEMVGIAELKKIIAREAAQFEQMGVQFNRNWKAARDELINHPEPRISYGAFSKICANHGLSKIDTDTLAHLMHDLGYIVHYSDDEKLRDDVVLKPEWLTKAIGFVLEDRTTQEMDGILPDERLFQVWHDHEFNDQPRYAPELYPFFLRLMEKYDVSYRLPDGKASLVAQHVPQVRPELPWLPENDFPEKLRRIAIICSMDEDPPGLVPWMIVRTHDYATEHSNKEGEVHRLYWQKGMFLRNQPHGEAMLEKRGREFHVYTQATYPEYFMNVLQEILQKLIKDNWPGLEGRYRFAVPCPTYTNGKPCTGRFNIQALRQFMSKGVQEYPCQECFQSHPIAKLLLGFEERQVDVQLREINEKLDGLNSRIADYFMATMRAIADEAKHGPRLFTLRSNLKFSLKELFVRPMEVQLWCEAEDCQHPVVEAGKGIYPISQPRQWMTNIAPYANFALKVLTTVAPIAAPAINTFFGPKTTETWGINDQLSLANAILGKLPKVAEYSPFEGGMLSEPERSGILALHQLIKEQDPTNANLGLYRVPTYTGDFRWLCKRHLEAWKPNIPDVIG